MNNGIFNIDENGILTGLKGKVTVPEGVTEIANQFHVFNDCQFITSVNIPSTCTEISPRFVESCRNITEFTVAEENPAFTTEDGVIYTKDKKTLIRYPSGKKAEIYRVNAGAEVIETLAFEGTRDTYEIFIGHGCHTIKRGAFYSTDGYVIHDRNCQKQEEHFGIKKYYISPSVVNIEEDIFTSHYCEDGDYYSDVIVGGEIGSVIWEHCNKRGIKFAEVTEEEAEAFLTEPYEVTCQKLKEKVENEVYVFEFPEEGYAGKKQGGTLTLYSIAPEGTPVTVTNLSSKFPEMYYENVTELILGNGITSFGHWEFCDYRKLHTVRFGADITEIDANAFYQDCRVTEYTVDEENKYYTSIDGIVFTKDLKTLVIYPSGREDEYYAIPDHVETVGHHAMMGSKVRYVKFGDNVKRIETEACYNTYGQTRFYVSPSVTELNDPFIFGVDGDYQAYVCCRDLVVGGKAGSAIEQYCKENGRDGITFQVLEDDEIEEWLTSPPEPICEEEEYIPQEGGMHF